jgi:hypothetical protein
MDNENKIMGVPKSSGNAPRREEDYAIEEFGFSGRGSDPC